MSFNNQFVVGLISGAIIVDYAELRYRAWRSEKPVKQALNASQYVKPLKQLDKNYKRALERKI